MTVRLSNVADPERCAEIEMIVDSGAIFSVVPEGSLRAIGVAPQSRETFWLADGRRVRRDVGHAMFEIEGRRGPSSVVFGLGGMPPSSAWSRSSSWRCRSTPRSAGCARSSS